MESKQTILLIEDDHDIRVAFRMALENCGYSVLSVANGWDALAVLERISPPKLIILDLSMPIMSGEEFLKLKNEHSKLAPIPVLIVSCHENRLKILSKYPALKKPVDMEVLTKKVLSCLEYSITE